MTGLRYLRGPNPVAPRWGLYSILSLDVGEEAILRWTPPSDLPARISQGLSLGFQAGTQTSAAILAAETPFVALLLSVFDLLTRSHCVDPAQGWEIDRMNGEPRLFLPCDEENIAQPALLFAFIVSQAIAGVGEAGQRAPAILVERYGQIKSLFQAESLDAASLAIARSALGRGIPCRRLVRRTQFLALGQGRKARRVLNGLEDDAGALARALGAEAYLALSFLRGQGFPTPKGDLAADLRQAQRLAEEVGYPLTIRPRSAGRDAAIAANSADEFATALAKVRPSGGIIIEQHLPGEDHALNVVAGVCAAPGVHADNRALAARAARVIGLADAVVVVRATDIGVSWRESPAAIVEARPAHDAPPSVAPTRREAASALLGRLFPGAEDGRIPTAGVTGSLGKSTTCHMVAAILAKAGLIAGQSTTQGVWIGADKTLTGDYAGGRGAGALVLDPAVQAAVFEMARGGLIKRGMGIDAVDVGAVLNVHDNHLGLDGVETREALAAVKSLVVRHARKLAILNADDPLCLKMRDVITAPKLCLVSTAPENPHVAAHQAAGGLAGWLVRGGEDGRAAEIRLYEGHALIGMISAWELPASLEGRFEPPLINALYAAAIAHGMGIDFGAIRAALAEFASTQQTNPFRMNFFEGFPYQLCLTWADGPAPYAALGRFAARTPVTGAKTLMFSMMGDRTDAFMDQTMAALSASGGFERYIVSDWEALRGRADLEAADRLVSGLIAGGVPPGRITRAASYDAACEETLARAAPGDLVVIVTPRVGGERLVKRLRALRLEDRAAG